MGGARRRRWPPTTPHCHIRWGARTSCPRWSLTPTGGRAATGCAPASPTCATATPSEAAVAGAERRWGGLDAAIAAAGVMAGGVPLWELPPEQERAVLEVNLGGVVNLAHAAVPALLRRPQPRSGRFLAVASAAATRGLPMLAAYCAAKAGVTGLIRALGAELGGTGVTANAVSPGSTDTPILTESARLYGLPAADSFAAQQPDTAAARPGRDRRGAGLPGRAGEQRHDRCGRRRSTGDWRCESLRTTARACRRRSADRVSGSCSTAAPARSLPAYGPAARPTRVVRLTPAGRAVWRRLSAGPVDSPAAGTLARRLTDAGLAHPCPPPVAAGAADLTIVIPVRDRAALLDRCLAALGKPVSGRRRRRRLAGPGRGRRRGRRSRRDAGASGRQRRAVRRPEHRPGTCRHRSGRLCRQ